jgi:two-component system, response regulator RegA
VKSPSILLVDDSALARAATTRLLWARGLTVTALSSHAEATAIDPSAFSAALLDIELGDGFGTEVAERLRQRSPELPIAFLTGGGALPVLDVAHRFGPVFSKTSGVEEAISWIAEAARVLDG